MLETKSTGWIGVRERQGHNQGERTRRPAETNILSNSASLGWLPALTFTSACGLLLTAFANTTAFTDADLANALMYAGLLLQFVPIAARLFSANPSRRERIGLVILLVTGLYLVKILRSPVMFIAYDELLHLRTVQDILRTGHLFHGNSLLPVSPLYPGLELVTTAVARLTRLPVFESGILMLGVARALFGLTLFLFYEQVSGSPRAAGIATLLYSTNLGFVFFDAQFAYESLALPLGVFALFLLARRLTRHETQRGATLALLLTIAAVIVIHHLSSFALIGFLVLILLMGFFTKQSTARRLDMSGIVAFSVVVALVWLLQIAPTVIYYLSPYTAGAVTQMIGLILQGAVTRPLFADYAGQTTPLWERVVSLASVGLGIVGIPWGLVEIWRRYRKHLVLSATQLSPEEPTRVPSESGTAMIALALGVASLAYGATLPLRLMPSVVEVSSRSAEFLFLAIAFVLTLGPVQRWVSEVVNWKRVSAATALATALFIGGFILGAGPAWARLPGPYLVSADLRSIEPEGLTAAQWMLDHLGPGNRIAADRVNSLLAVSFGLQRPIYDLGDQVDVSPMYFSSEFGEQAQAILEAGDIRYILVDHRMSEGLPRIGIYFQPVEPLAYQHKNPIPAEALAKFDQVPSLSRVFDSGDIVIYEVQETGRPYVHP